MGEERRITDLTEISAFRANDYIAVDNASEAQTKKLPATAITNPISAAQTDATRALNIARSTSSFPTGDAYSSSSAYKVGDMVIYNNTLYRCKTACSAASWSVNANNFEATSLASALTDVNNDLNYSTNETLTGGHWIDGKDIYRKVITGTTGTTGADDNVARISNTVGALISVSGYLVETIGSGRFTPLFFTRIDSTFSGFFSTIVSPDGYVSLRYTASPYKNSSYVLVFEYTKN